MSSYFPESKDSTLLISPFHLPTKSTYITATLKPARANNHIPQVTVPKE